MSDASIDETAIELPVIEDLPEGIELDSDIIDNEQYRSAVRNAAAGQYENTMLEMWENIIDTAIGQATSGVTIPVADGLLRQWPWLEYKHLPKYLAARVKMLVEAKTILLVLMEDKKETLYKENENDWLLHKDLYIAVFVEWNRACNKWTDDWEKISLHIVDKGIMHAAIADICAFLINERSGLLEYMTNLAGYEVTDDERKEISQLIAGVEDE